MIDPRKLSRIAVVGLACAATGASPAAARVADAPSRAASAVGGQSAIHAHDLAHARRSTMVADGGIPPRVNGIGANRAPRTTAPAVALTQARDETGFGWRSAAIGAAALVSLALLALAARSALEARRRVPVVGSRAGRTRR